VALQVSLGTVRWAAEGKYRQQAAAPAVQGQGAAPSLASVSTTAQADPRACLWCSLTLPESGAKALGPGHRSDTSASAGPEHLLTHPWHRLYGPHAWLGRACSARRWPMACLSCLAVLQVDTAAPQAVLDELREAVLHRCPLALLRTGVV
jgi:hypothetical protein